MNPIIPKPQVPDFEAAPDAAPPASRGRGGKFIAWTPLLALGLAGGCSLAPKNGTPPVETPAAYKEAAAKAAKPAAGWKTAEPKDDIIRGRWWELFGDSTLSGLEAEVNVSNQTIGAAFANFQAARAVVKQARAQFFPLVTANPSVLTGQQTVKTSTSSGSGSTNTTVTATQFALPLDASWELDLWGRIRNTVKASSLEAQATLADLENTRLTMQAELAVDYFQLRALDSQKQLLDSAAQAYDESLKLTRYRHSTGIASDQDVAQAETQLNTTLAQATDLGIQRAQLEHAIALLIGRPASVVSIPVASLKAGRFTVPVGVPSQLLERRPDIAAAERRTAEANARIGVARAAYFPTLTLTGVGATQSTTVGSLFSGPSFLWSVGGSLAGTIFDAGRNRAVTEQAWANYNGIVANYRQTVLTGFKEVEDNLSTLRILAHELQQQDAAVASSQQYLNLANDRYRLGIDSYLNVITAQTTLLSNQRTAVNLRMEQMTASVQLVKALGGGWSGGKD